MDTQIKIEELLMFAASIFLFSLTDYSWWVYPALILLPDIGMLGYLVNTRIGALTYNLFHHKGIALIVLVAGYYFNHTETTLAGIILFGHSSMDRIMGYGLKYPDNFKHTHLGWLK